MPLELAYLQTFRIIINAISGIEILDTLDGYIIKMSMVQKKVDIKPQLQATYVAGLHPEL